MTAPAAILAVSWGGIRADLSVETIVVIVALVISAVKWLKDQVTEASSQTPPAPKAPAQEESIRPRAVPRGTSEEERMRKFMEALGLPPDAARPIPAHEAPTLRPAAEKPAPARQPELRPVPPIITQPTFPRRGANRPLKPPPIPAPAQERSLDEAEAPTKPVEQIHLGPLQTAELPTFQTASSVVSAIPFESLAMENAGHVVPESSVAAEARALVRSPRAIRSAVLLREILGPPRGLQTGTGTHTFPAR
jgi:hypothetical protein